MKLLISLLHFQNFALEHVINPPNNHKNFNNFKITKKNVLNIMFV